MKVISESKAWILGAWIGEYEQELNNTFRPGHKRGPFCLQIKVVICLSSCIYTSNRLHDFL